ncbi:MAG: ABC transporter substrate-binding protein [Clostridiaceae bacterium]|nr:ABC transporter substrate-binding protein [Eubacteriales bacterium]NLV48839.1 ABC transporter substrate-binding protein [Clostridiaceae bacterium]
MLLENKAVGRLAILCVITLIILLAGGACQSSGTEPTVNTQTTDYPVTVNNASGESVVISDKPQAIVATSVWIGEMLLDLVESDRIKALSAWGDDPVLSAAAEKASKVAARVNTQDPEGIVAVQPDLVLIDTFSDADGSLTRTLTDAGIVVLQLASPVDYDSIKEALTTISIAVGERDQGDALIQTVDQTLADIQSKLADLPESEKLTTLFYEDYYDASGSSAGMLAAYGSESPFEAIATAAGLINVCDVKTYSAISKEKVVGEWKPDVLVVPSFTFGSDFKAIEDNGAAIIESIKNDPLIQTLPAVQSDRIVALTETYRGSTSHYMVFAAEELARFAYPSYFSDGD